MKNISIIFLLFSLIVHDTHARIHWPEGKKAAVILTYDDGLKSQLQIVIPQLEKHNFRGTFFLYGQVIKEEDIPEWRKASQRGHELGTTVCSIPVSPRPPGRPQNLAILWNAIR